MTLAAVELQGWDARDGVVLAPDTLRHMADVVARDVGHPIVWQTAASIVRGIDGRDYAGQLARIAQWLRLHTRFLRDPAGRELLRSPALMLETIQSDRVAAGDCDDVAMLGAALAMAIGFSASFVAEGWSGADGPFAHVFTIVDTVKGPLSLDIQRPADFTRPPDRRIQYAIAL